MKFHEGIFIKKRNISVGEASGQKNDGEICGFWTPAATRGNCDHHIAMGNV